MYLFSMESASARQARLDDLVERVLHRLGDSDQKIWTYTEIEASITQGALEMGASVNVILDMAYLECIPPGFSYTSAWEKAFARFDYGHSGYTSVNEAEYAAEVIKAEDTLPGGFTCPAEITYLASIGASTALRSVGDVPDDAIEIERGVYNHLTVVATSHRHAEDYDNRFQTQTGPIIAYTLDNEGYRRIRKIRVPTMIAGYFGIEGSWGTLRLPTEITTATVTGTWGIPRRVDGHHPMGDTHGWGIARRFYDDNYNFRIEYWRQPRADANGSELTNRYFLYLGDFAQWRALTRSGPGQNYKLAQLYKDRWERGLARIKNRVNRQNNQKLRRAGGSDMVYKAGPPRPRLPWQYGQTVR